MPTSLWHLGTCDPFHIICLNGHNYPGPPMIIEVSEEQQHEVRITGSLVRGWISDATLLASRCSCFTILLNAILLTVTYILIVCLINNVWLNVKILFCVFAKPRSYCRPFFLLSVNAVNCQNYDRSAYFFFYILPHDEPECDPECCKCV